MSYQVIARKWRPQKFDDVVFQGHITRTLQNSIKASRISHAYLFSGPRGVGKTTLARILAKALNCVHGPAPEPCCECENCIEIKNGSFFDVIEIDGASNNGIDDIRQLRENVNFAPIKGSYKVYIIDEVHMVTTQAFNALLKTLEEPPAHVVFIFATTEFHKIPETILSRCQKFFFKQIPVDNIVDHLMHIAEREGFEISDDAVYPIARASGGSMRDAQSLLDQIIAFSSAKSGEICEADVLTILGIVPFDSYNALLKSISVCDPVAVINEVDRICGLGADISRYASGFADVLRAIRLIKHSSMPADILGISESEAKKFKEVAEFFADEEISRMYKLSSDLLSAFKSCGNERIALEMALLDMINVKKTPSVASLIRKFEGNVSSASSVGNVGVDSVGVKQAAGYSDINKKQEFFVSDNKSLDNFSGVSDLKSKPVSDVSDSSGAVEKIKNIFHGQVMDKGD